MYTERLSEKVALTGAEFDTAAGGATATITLTDLDMSERHRARVIFIAQVKDFASGTGAQAATAKGTIKSIKLQASTSTAFGGTPTTLTALGCTTSSQAFVRTSGGSIATTTSTAILNAVTTSAGGATVSSTTASTVATVSMEIDGETIQAARSAEDRYIRAICKLAVDASSDRGFLTGLYEADLGRYKPVSRTA